MRTSWLLPAFALAASGCIVEAPSGESKPLPEVERARAQALAVPPLMVRHAANIDGKVELVSAMAQPGQAVAGDPVKVTAVFKALEEMAEDYTIFVHVEDADGRVERMNVDHKPAGGQYPTNRWKKGDMVRDEFLVYVPPVPVRALNVWIGLWESRTDTRLRLRNPEKVTNDGKDRILLIQIPVAR